jgi:outer membrane receptor protein involved in Fe transport
MPYFVNSIISGQFDVNFSPARTYNFYTNILFHLGPGGEFYGSAEYNDVKNLNGNVIPYQPKIKASVSYGYNFDFGLYAEPKIYFNSESYADAINSVKTNPFVNLAIKFGYKFVPNFSINAEISNILDRKNIHWNGYREAPLDLMAGFTYKW